jgi:hypothetical protein
MFSLEPSTEDHHLRLLRHALQWREVLLREIGRILSSQGRSDSKEASAILDTFSRFSLGDEGEAAPSIQVRIGFRSA